MTSFFIFYCDIFFFFFAILVVIEMQLMSTMTVEEHLLSSCTSALFMETSGKLCCTDKTPNRPLCSRHLLLIIISLCVFDGISPKLHHRVSISFQR